MGMSRVNGPRPVPGPRPSSGLAEPRAKGHQPWEQHQAATSLDLGQKLDYYTPMRLRQAEKRVNIFHPSAAPIATRERVGVDPASKSARVRVGASGGL